MYFWSTEQDEILKLNYAHLQAREIALLVNKSEGAVQQRVIRLGLKKGFKKFHCNNHFFSKPNNKCCYWAGLLAADGWIREKGHQLCLSLKLSDGSHVETFAKDLKFDGPVKTRACKNYKTAIVEICGVPGLLKDLVNRFSVTPRKSLTLKPPRLQKLDHKLAFIKGYWDGDGCIRMEKGRLEVSCCGTIEVLTWIQKIFDRLVPPFGRYHAIARPRRSGSKVGKNHADYKLTGRRAELIFEMLHQVETPELVRKWAIASQCIDNSKELLV